jgi:hypothetical protein
MKDDFGGYLIEDEQIAETLKDGEFCELLVEMSIVFLIFVCAFCVALF